MNRMELAVAAAAAAAARKKKRLLLVTNKQSAPHPNLFVLGTGSKKPAIGTEADAANIQIAVAVYRIVLQGGHLVARLHVKDLGAPVTAGGDVLSVLAEAHAAHDAVVVEGVDELDVQQARDPRVEESEPVGSLLLLAGGDALGIEVGKVVADRRQGGHRAGAGNLRRRARVLVGALGLALLRRAGARGRSRSLLGAWRGGRLRGLRVVSWDGEC